MVPFGNKQHYNIDGLKKVAKPKPKGPVLVSSRVFVATLKPFDGVKRYQSKPKTKPAQVSPKPVLRQAPSPQHRNVRNIGVLEHSLYIVQKLTGPFRQLEYRQYVLPLVVFCSIAAFLGGMGFALSTPQSAADAEDIPATPPGHITLEIPNNNLAALGPIQQLPNDVLFNLSISQLEDYLEDVGENITQQKKEELLKDRTEKLKQYLESKKSPFAPYAEVLAKQPHWKVMLAISFAESTFGRNCKNFNCSNIGVKPGHVLWREYRNYGEWLVDFNKLLERRYKDWSLEDMNGVYVQPKNPNWLLATKQVLTELSEWEIK